MKPEITVEKLKRTPGKRDADWGAEHGQVTVLMAVFIGITVSLCVAISGLSSVMVGRAQAQSAADMAALGASFASYGYISTQPCTLAAQIARENNAELRECSPIGNDYHVKISYQVLGPLRVALTAHARAGPLHLPAAPP